MLLRRQWPYPVACGERQESSASQGRLVGGNGCLGNRYMGLFSWLLQWFRRRPEPSPSQLQPSQSLPASDFSATQIAVSDNCQQKSLSAAAVVTEEPRPRKRLPKSARIRLTPNRRIVVTAAERRAIPFIEASGVPPYRYARYGSRTDHYLDLSQDGSDERLQIFGLPVFHTPEQLAEWIGIPLNRVAWLIHRFSNGRPESQAAAHYHFHWVKKRAGGWRLIESPKGLLKQVQTKILHELLDHVPAHANSHGFTKSRSILTNARPHTGQAVVLKFDLSNFYTTVSFARVVAIFRSLGYSREVAIWLGSLVTSAVPGNLKFQEQGPYALVPYLRRHLPQGAPTSPALANLSAFGLDIRLSGLAKSYGANYTRYADDLTFSGPKEFNFALSTIIPLVQQIVRQERFQTNAKKRQILRSHQRQTVAGVVVNQRPNVARCDFDQLKAILTNCVRLGPSTQNRVGATDFYQHLRGRIAHIQMLNPLRGERLTQLFLAIDWTR